MPRRHQEAKPRSDVERNRAAILDAAVRQLAHSPVLEMRRLAAVAGVSRSTLYRRFGNADDVRRAVLDRALADARNEARAALAADAPPLALLRQAVRALTAVGARYPVPEVAASTLGDRIDPVARELLPVVHRVLALTELTPAPTPRALRAPARHLAETALRSGAVADDPSRAANDLFTALTEPLDRGLVVLDARGRLLACNPLAAEAFSLAAPKPGRRLTNPAVETVYEDGSPSPDDAYPLARAVVTASTQPAAVRGHRGADGTLRWFAIAVLVLARVAGERPYAILGVLSEVTREKQAELAQLQPPGTLGRERPVPLDIVRVLDEVPAHLLPDQIIAEARRLARVPLALYVVDIDGSRLLRLAGAAEFPARIEAPLALGPELAHNGLPELRARLARELPGSIMAPMWLRGRAVGILLSLGGPEETLADVARLAAPAIELANGYTDVFDAARRRKEINPAAEIQQSLLPPRIARLGAGEVAAGILPSYEVGGDWFDYVENRDGAWLAIADAAGRGPRAGALGGLGLAALRAARRNQASLEEAVRTIHETIYDAGEDEFFLTAVVARWSAAYASFSWVNSGHPPPLLLAPDGKVEELAGEATLPLGVGARRRAFRRSYRQLEPDDRVILYTDGVSARPKRDGFFGKDGIVRAARAAHAPSAPEIARSIQEAVATASRKPLRDDAAVIVLAPHA